MTISGLGNLLPVEIFTGKIVNPDLRNPVTISISYIRC
jgi:hypothetical protein